MKSNQLELKRLRKKALFLSYFTVGYNILEGAVSIFAGVLAGSIALLGFGLDSFVESLSGGVMIWRFHQHKDLSEEEEEKLEKRATRLVACTFFILGAYILYESVKKLLVREIPEPSIIGMAVAVASIIVMPVLFAMKYRTGLQLKSKSLIADSKETLACLFLSIALFVGLGMNYQFGFWQADPIVGLIVVVFLSREGYEILTEKD
jgi:cation diffusion facilitator family transporter